MKYNNLDYWEAVKLLAERGGVPLPEDNGYDSKRTDTRKRFYEMNKTAARFFYHQLKTPQGKECLDYLINKRKLSIETIKKYGMGFAPNSWSALKGICSPRASPRKNWSKARLSHVHRRIPEIRLISS